MSSIYLLDTPILVDFLNDIHEAKLLMSDLKPKEIGISVITYTEALVGIDDHLQKESLESMIENFFYFSIEKSTAQIAADLKRKYRWKLPDAYQAAIAIEHKMTLLTRNTKDFNPSVHKFVKIPYKLK